MKITNYELDDKVDKFIEWYKKNKVIGHYTETGEFNEPRKLRDFIEKMAVWYELRYPEYEVNRLMPGSNQEMKKINSIMFYENSEINKVLNPTNNLIDINWSQFYNFDRFIKSLPTDEASFLWEPDFRALIYLNINGINTHYHINSDGTIDEAEQLGLATKYQIRNEDVEGRNLYYLLNTLKQLNIKIPKNNELENKIKYYEINKKLKEEILNCVMYRIIERGGNRIGPRRAFMFAKEFNLSIDIPMRYGIDHSDPGLLDFINEYIKAGGTKDLVCISNYFSREKKNQFLDTEKIIDIINREVKYCSLGYSDYDKENYNLIKSILEYKETKASTSEELGIKDNKMKQLKK